MKNVRHMKKIYAIAIFTTLCMSAIDLLSYYKFCVVEYEYNRPFEDHEIAIGFKGSGKRGHKRDADYCYTENNNKIHCYVRLSQIDKIGIKRVLAKYDPATIITSEMVDMFLDKRIEQDRVVGWVLQDFMKHYSQVTVARILEELCLDKTHKSRIRKHKQ